MVSLVKSKRLARDTMIGSGRLACFKMILHQSFTTLFLYAFALSPVTLLLPPHGVSMSDTNGKTLKVPVSNLHDLPSYDSASSHSPHLGDNVEHIPQNYSDRQHLPSLNANTNDNSQQRYLQIVVDQATPLYKTELELQQRQTYFQPLRNSENDLSDTRTSFSQMRSRSASTGNLFNNGSYSPHLQVPGNKSHSDEDDDDNNNNVGAVSSITLRRNNTTSRLRRKSTKKGMNTSEEFNWDDEDEGHNVDDGKSRGRNYRICSPFQHLIGRLPYGLRCLLYTIIGDAIIFAVVGLPDFVLGLNRHEVSNGKKKLLPFLKWTSTWALGNMPLLVLSIYLIISWTLHYATLFVLSIVPNIIERAIRLALGTYYGERLSEYLNYFRKLRNDITVAIWIILSLMVWTVFIVALDWKWKMDWKSEFKDPPSQYWWDIVQSVMLCLVVISTIWTAHKLLLEVIRTLFHRRAYKDRVAQSNYANSVLGQFVHVIENVGGQFSAPNSPNARVRHFKESSSKVGAELHAKNKGSMSGNLKMTDKSSKNKKIHKMAGKFIGKALNTIVSEINNVMLDPCAMESMSNVPSTIQQSNTLARALYYLLIKDGQEKILPSNFLPYFKNEQEAHRAFKLFDGDGNGSISRSELKSVMSELTNEKLSIEASIVDVASAVSSLGYITASIVVFLIILIILAIWKTETDKFLSALAAIILPASFIFGSTAKEIFESIIFLFIIHPFDVGDRVEITNEEFIVRSLSINTTILERKDGRIVYAPNALLKTKMIDNTRRSGRQSESVLLKVDIKTTDGQLQGLRAAMLDYLQSESKELIQTFNITVKEVLIAERALKLSVTIDHKSNWQDSSKKSARRNRYMFALRNAILSLGIECPETAAPETGHN